MTNLLVLIISILSGLVLRQSGIVDKSASVPLNKIIIYFFLPILSLKYIPGLSFQSSYWWLVLCPWFIYLGSITFFLTLQRFLNLDRITTGVLIMTGGISSTSFVGFPIFEMLYGDEGLIAGIIMSLAGTIVVFNTIGIFTSFWYTEGQPRIDRVLVRMFRFPPFLAFIFALFLNSLGYQHPSIIYDLLDALSKPFNVFVLLTIGIQLELKVDKAVLRPLLLGLCYKLLLAPLLVYCLLYFLYGEVDLITKVCILGAAIGSMNAMSIMAAQLGLRPQLAVQMPSIGIPLSVPVLLLIDYLFF